ncbi:MAG: recombinase RecT [Pusillimonas sp.]|nr:recombinase RecT [Pusillimonas sp.]MBC42812.1 recombinase RecT [Pusillimonas sp.]HCP78618.1 recombinase RecT [Pusillimonas sp.]|tara:strand:+ start:15374 stop:16420 length:1047 start_codon:yes stop_codon:yes gene_type:complete
MSSAQLKAIATGEVTKQQLAAMPPKKQIAHLLEQRKSEISKMLPKHLTADRLLKVAQIAATTTPGLLECEIPTLVSAIGQCAQMGLEPNTVLGHAYLVPFNTKRKDGEGRERWVKSVQVIVGYKGLIDLARRSGQIVSIAAHEVCKNDHFDLVYGLEEKLEHRPAMGDRGPIIGFYAVAKLVGGGYAFEFMSRYEVDAIKESSQSKGKYGPWKDHYTEMGRKTVIRRLSKYLPLSIEFQAATTLDEMADRGQDQRLDENTIDGNFIFSPTASEDGANIDPETGELKADDAAPITYDYQKLLLQIQKSNSTEALDLIGDQLRDLPEGDDYVKLHSAYTERRQELEAAAT